MNVNYTENQCIDLQDKKNDSNYEFNGIDLETGQPMYRSKENLEISHEDTWEIDLKANSEQCTQEPPLDVSECKFKTIRTTIENGNEVHYGISEMTPGQTYRMEIVKIGPDLDIELINKSLKNTWGIDEDRLDDKCIVSSPQSSAEDRYGPILETLLRNQSQMVPCSEKSKKPVKGFKWKNQSLIKSIEVQQHLNDDPNINLGLKMGFGLVVWDFDEPGAYELFREKHPEIKTLVVKSGRAGGGYHVYFKNSTLAHRNLEGKFKMFIDDKHVGELKHNGYIMLPGSVHDKSGQLYQIHEGDFGHIAEAHDEFLLQYQKKTSTPTTPSQTKHKAQSNDLEAKFNLLPYKDLSLNEKYNKIHLGRRYLIEQTRKMSDDCSDMDYHAMFACLYAGISEDEMIQLAHRFPKGLAGRHNVKGHKDAAYDYLRNDYRNALRSLDIDRVLNAAKRCEDKAYARAVRSEIARKTPPEVKAFNSIRKMFKKRKASVLTWRQMTDSKIFKCKKDHLPLLDKLISEGKLRWVKENYSIELVD